MTYWAFVERSFDVTTPESGPDAYPVQRSEFTCGHTTLTRCDAVSGCSPSSDDAAHVTVLTAGACAAYDAVS